MFFISWRLITLQYRSGFCHTLTWISHGFTCVPQTLGLKRILRLSAATNQRALLGSTLSPPRCHLPPETGGKAEWRPFPSQKIKNIIWAKTINIFSSLLEPVSPDHVSCRVCVDISPKAWEQWKNLEMHKRQELPLFPPWQTVNGICHLQFL